METKHADVVLWVPATSSHIHLLRTVAASACASMGFSVDDIDDVRLAVAEAAAQLLATDPSPGTTMVMRLGRDGDQLQVNVLLAGSSARLDGLRSATEESLAWLVLQALGENVRIVEDGDGVGIAFWRPATAIRPAP